jgi:hypothetical protein
MGKNQQFNLTEVHDLGMVDRKRSDSALLLAASWEERCLGLVRKFGKYQCGSVLLTVYDGVSDKRAKHLAELRSRLTCCKHLLEIPALHVDPIPNVRKTLTSLRKLGPSSRMRLSIDISTYTRRHLLQLLQGLDLAGMLSDCRFLYSEQDDYHTQDNEPLAKGIGPIEAVKTFGGSNRPSKDSLLVLFLGFEGRRAQAVWERLEPNVTLAILPEPTLRPDWKGRAEEQNRYLLSCLPPENIIRSPSTDPTATYRLLKELSATPRLSAEKYNYLISPVGTKAQVVGLYRFWRQNPFLATVVYAAPGRYREEQATFGPGRTWLLDRTATWEPAIETLTHV